MQQFLKSTDPSVVDELEVDDLVWYTAVNVDASIQVIKNALWSLVVVYVSQSSVNSTLELPIGSLETSVAEVVKTSIFPDPDKASDD